MIFMIDLSLFDFYINLNESTAVPDRNFSPGLCENHVSTKECALQLRCVLMRLCMAALQAPVTLLRLSLSAASINMRYARQALLSGLIATNLRELDVEVTLNTKTATAFSILQVKPITKMGIEVKIVL